MEGFLDPQPRDVLAKALKICTKIDRFYSKASASKASKMLEAAEQAHDLAPSLKAAASRLDPADRAVAGKCLSVMASYRRDLVRLISDGLDSSLEFFDPGEDSRFLEDSGRHGEAS